MRGSLATIPPVTATISGSSSGPTSLEDVRGWFNPEDQLAFKWILEAQSAAGITGDLVEIGVYEGKTAIHMGNFLRHDESLTVCDLFDDVVHADGVPDHIRQAYASLSQQTFERNYLAFHHELPEIVRGRSVAINDHVEPASVRFVHIDASHLYGDVRDDTRAARRMLTDGGVVAFDDYRTMHTAGTSAAVWEAIANDGLRPIALTQKKIYATWSDPGPYQSAVTKRLRHRSDLRPATIPLRDGHVVRFAPRRLERLPESRGSAAETRSVPRRVLKTTGIVLHDLGYRMVRLANHRDPVASLRRSVRLRGERLAGVVRRRTDR